ncbi:MULTISPECIES: macro domain-containing protein [unclassified Calothrix]|uniref:macro domain-containing protein n=1 Tax=unclassified Calothrix TaxID=2619626 RepID=UPI001F55081D|nr:MULTISPECIES: macro domain-containing protein [unclassified Calothrix]
MLAFVSEQDARTTLDYQNEFIKWYGYLRHAALVNTVNCVGVMGKGIALQFKQAYPENFRLYEQACRAGNTNWKKECDRL